MDVTSPGGGVKGRITKKNGGWKRGGVSEDTSCDTILLFCSEDVRVLHSYACLNCVTVLVNHLYCCVLPYVYLITRVNLELESLTM